MARSKKSTRKEIVLQIPDLGLSDAQMTALKRSFKSQIVSSMGERARASTRIIIIRIRVVRAVREV